MTMAGPQRREFRGSMEGKRRPLMLKDFLNDTSSTHASEKRRSHRRSSNESPTTVRHFLEMKYESKKKAFQGSGIVPFNSASSTRSALHKASEAIVKLLPFLIGHPSHHGHGTTIPRSHNDNKLGSILQRVTSVRDSHDPKGSLSKRLSAVMRSLSHRNHLSKRGAETLVRVRDIVRWTSFGEAEMMDDEYCNSKTPPQGEAHLQKPDATSDSFSCSRTSSCTWSEFGQESDCTSNLQSSSGSSVCSGEADRLKDNMLLLNYHSKKEDEVAVEDILEVESCGRPTPDTPLHPLGFTRAGGLAMSEGESDSLDTADTGRFNEQEDDIQQLKHRGNGCTICCDVEGYEEKEQFSPISVLDFPFEDEVATTCSEDSLANIGRTKQQLLQKVGQHETLAELDPLDGKKCFASSRLEFSDEESESFTVYGNHGDDPNDDVEIRDVEECIREILNEYLDASTNRQWGSFESLVIDIFREESSFGSELNEDELVKTATGRVQDWLVKGNEVDDDRKLCVREMEMNQDWRKFTMDEDEMAAEMEVTVLRCLVHELLLDLVD